MNNHEDEVYERFKREVHGPSKIMVQVNDLRGQDDEPESEPSPVIDPQAEFQRRYEENVKLVQEATLAKMSPPGALSLPPELEAARWKHGLIDPVFRQPLYDRILIWQLKNSDVDLQDSRIQVTDMTRARLAQESPRGVLVGAGAGAMDVLRTHGIKLGYTVTFLRNSSWRIKVGEVLHQPVVLMPMTVGDIVDCDELSILVRTGKVGYKWLEGAKVHVFMDESGESHAPVTPHMGADYAN
jgi:hypothetical protein